jgi:hypothetical protein
VNTVMVTPRSLPSVVSTSGVSYFDVVGFFVQRDRLEAPEGRGCGDASAGSFALAYCDGVNPLFLRLFPRTLDRIRPGNDPAVRV